MRQLLPHHVEEVDPLVTYLGDDRQAHPDRPWVAVVMISSADGAATLEGRSGGLGGPGDRQVMRAYRSLADVILVGAGTVRAERYNVPRPASDPSGAAEERRPRLVVVTASCDIDPGLPLFGDPDHPPIVATTPAADPALRSRTAEVAEVILIGEGPAVDLRLLLSELASRGVGKVVSEGGPTLLADMIEGGLVDELSLTVAPLLVSGDAPRIAHSDVPPPDPAALMLHRVLEEDDQLFLTYRRAVSAPSPGQD